MQQLLLFEALMRLGAGLVLIIAPRIAVRIAGLPEAGKGFWTRLFGAALVGLAGASILETQVSGTHGLGLAGSIIINLTMASVLGALLVLHAGPITMRGRILAWFVFSLLLLLSLVELAYA